MQDVPYGFCQCGCGEETKVSRGGPVPYGQHRRFLHGHNHRLRVEYVEEDRGHETPCWIWQGGITPNGYGHVSRKGRAHPCAHRDYYLRLVGPIEPGLTIDHLCGVRPCVNPAHMEPVTQAENNRRAAYTLLTPEKVREIRASSESLAALGRRYGVHPETIGSVRRGQSWKDVV